MIKSKKKTTKSKLKNSVSNKELKAKIAELITYSKQLELIVSEKNKEISELIEPQAFFDMRLRAQKAELALEALTLAQANNLVSTNLKKYTIFEEIKTLLEKFVVN